MRIEGAGFGGEDGTHLRPPRDFHLPHGERAEAVWVAGHDDSIFGQKYK